MITTINEFKQFLNENNNNDDKYDVESLIGKEVFANIGEGENIIVTSDLIDSIGEYLDNEEISLTIDNFITAMANLELNPEEEEDLVRNGNYFDPAFNDSLEDMLADMRDEEDYDDDDDDDDDDMYESKKSNSFKVGDIAKAIKKVTYDGGLAFKIGDRLQRVDTKKEGILDKQGKPESGIWVKNLDHKRGTHKIKLSDIDLNSINEGKRSDKQYKKEVALYKYFVVNTKNNKVESGWEFKDDAKDALSDYDGDKNYKVFSELQLKKAGIENPKQKWMNESYEDSMRELWKDENAAYAKLKGNDTKELADFVNKNNNINLNYTYFMGTTFGELPNDIKSSVKKFLKSKSYYLNESLDMNKFRELNRGQQVMKLQKYLDDLGIEAYIEPLGSVSFSIDGPNDKDKNKAFKILQDLGIDGLDMKLSESIKYNKRFNKRFNR